MRQTVQSRRGDQHWKGDGLTENRRFRGNLTQAAHHAWQQTPLVERLPVGAQRDQIVRSAVYIVAHHRREQRACGSLVLVQIEWQLGLLAGHGHTSFTTSSLITLTPPYERIFAPDSVRC
jgi:hypothetical protein